MFTVLWRFSPWSFLGWPVTTLHLPCVLMHSPHVRVVKESSAPPFSHLKILLSQSGKIFSFAEQRPHFATRCYYSQSSSKKQHDVFNNYLIDPVATVPFPCVALCLLFKWKALQRPQNWGMTGIQNQMCLEKDWRKSDEGNTAVGKSKMLGLIRNRRKTLDFII